MLDVVTGPVNSEAGKEKSYFMKEIRSFPQKVPEGSQSKVDEKGGVQKGEKKNPEGSAGEPREEGNVENQRGGLSGDRIHYLIKSVVGLGRIARKGGEGRGNGIFESHLEKIS